MSQSDQVEQFNVKEWLTRHPEESITSFKISQPTRVGLGWTKVGSNFYYEDFSGLPELSLPPNLPIDLNHDIENFIPKDENSKGTIEILISALRAAGISPDSCQILTFRNNLNKIFGTVFDSKKSWIVDACFYGSTLFLEIVSGPPNEWEKTDEGKRMTAWGYQFEAKCTGSTAGDASSEYAMLIKTKLEGGLELCIGAEIDAYDPQKLIIDKDMQSSGLNVQSTLHEAPNLASLCELKTFKHPGHPGQWRTLYRYKHPAWWIQSFLAGVPNTILGERDERGLVHEIHTIRVSDLPKISRNNREPWNPYRSLAFGAQVLEWMKQVGSQHSNQHLRFNYTPDAIHSSMIKAIIVTDGDLPSRIQNALHAVVE